MSPPRIARNRRLKRGGAAQSGAATTARLRCRDRLLASIILPITTFSILGCEIILTRLFAYVFTYHLTALAVSFAVFGLGASAYVRVRWLAGLPQRTLAVVAHLASGTAPTPRRRRPRRARRFR
ncbi:MAG: hypothetical protein DMD81_21555 [Candidatus Rokuibacteriota bacterium]|nr:MAG: hypothetical protein DMD81_21555 [Candidatus Rokubacteria bacterium]